MNQESKLFSNSLFLLYKSGKSVVTTTTFDEIIFLLEIYNFIKINSYHIIIITLNLELMVPLNYM